MSPPTRRMILSLYASGLRIASSFSSYNFRTYFLRRTKDTFRAMQVESDPAKLSLLYTDAKNELAVLRRGAIVNQLYGGWRLALENPLSPQGAIQSGEAEKILQEPETTMERADN